ncbi:MAG: hypothetical protein R2939_00885 [Kofleriaceae bacterium]
MNRLILAAVLVAATATTAHAQSRGFIPVQGSLTDAEGTPLEGQVELRLTLYGDLAGTDVLHQETATVEVDHGLFSVSLGAEVALDPIVFQGLSDLFLGLKVGADDEMTPRLPIGTVPYAAWADGAADSARLDGQTPDELQADFESALAGRYAPSSQACAAGQVVTGLDAVGNLVCADDLDTDTDTTYSGADFALSGQGCAPGTVVTAIAADGTLACAADVDSTYDGSDFATSGQQCAPGTVAQGIAADGSLSCVADLDTNTTYSGADFALSSQQCAANERMVGIDASGAIQCAAVSLVPSGMIAFFAGACPTGFTEYTALRGRVVVGTPDGGTAEGTVGTGLADLADRTITDVPAHAHAVGASAALVSSTAGAHTHAVDPPATNATSAGAHGHAFYTATNDVNSPSSQGYPANSNHLAFRTTDRRQETRDNGNILSGGSHTHAVDIGSFPSGSGGDHSHTLTVPAHATDATGSAAVAVTMPYLQLTACVAQ